MDGGGANGLFLKLVHALGLIRGVCRDAELLFLAILSPWVVGSGTRTIHVGTQPWGWTRGHAWPCHGHLAAEHVGTRGHVDMDTRGRGHAWVFLFDCLLICSVFICFVAVVFVIVWISLVLDMFCLNCWSQLSLLYALVSVIIS